MRAIVFSFPVVLELCGCGHYKPHKALLQKYFLYASSSEKALMELRSWIAANEVPLPLFQNRLETSGGILGHEEPPKICVAISSARREGSPIKYLVQAVSALLNRMNFAKNRDQVYIHVFNVDNEPSKHQDIDLIRELVPVTNVKGVIKGRSFTSIPRKYQENLDSFEVMRIVQQIGCQYPIMLEDDALATANWVDQVNLAISQLQERVSDGTDWFVVKLFVARRFYRRYPLTYGLSSYVQGFNTVAFMMNPKFMPAFADSLSDMVRNAVENSDDSAHFPIDIYMERFRREEGLLEKSFEPVIFQHTGLYSSLSHQVLDVSSGNHWAFSSKYFDADGKPIVFDPTFWSLPYPSSL
jgi:hypothetical protein